MAVSKKVKAVEDKVNEVISSVETDVANKAKDMEAEVANKAKIALGDVKDQSLSFLRQINPLYLILGIVLIMTIIYFYLFSSNPTKKENDALKAEIAQIEKERKNVRDSLTNLSKDYTTIVTKLADKEAMLSNINQRLDAIDQRVANSSSQWNQVRASVSNINDQIKKATTKPDKKTGDDLLISLKSKIN